MDEFRKILTGQIRMDYVSFTIEFVDLQGI